MVQLLQQWLSGQRCLDIVVSDLGSDVRTSPPLSKQLFASYYMMLSLVMACMGTYF
jgi:hypothetical protein